MSHHHDHDHPHHDHDHDHHHHHDNDDLAHDHGHHPESAGTLTVEQKMIKLVTHWIRHNGDHEANYRDWAQKADAAGMREVAQALETAARLTGDTTAAFKRALAMLDPSGRD